MEFDLANASLSAPAPATLGDLVDRFVARTSTSTGRTLSPATARAYKSQLQSLVAVAGRGRPIMHVTKAHVEAAVQRPASSRSRSQYLRAIRALVRWAVARGWMVDITDGVVVDAGPTVIRPYLQPEEVEVMLAAASPSTRIRAGLILETGMRAGEAVHATWEWVVRGIGRPSIRIPAADGAWRAKGRRARSIPLSEAAQRWLDEARRVWPKTNWLLHDQPAPPQTSNWCRDVHRACRRAGTTDVDTHGLRRTAGVRWLAAGLSIYDVSRLLGHASVVTTERAYAGIADASWASVMDRVDEAAEVPRLAAARAKRRQ